jgi:hypothetical protein
VTTTEASCSTCRGRRPSVISAPRRCRLPRGRPQVSERPDEQLADRRRRFVTTLRTLE